jgi:hypothetical protein
MKNGHVYIERRDSGKYAVVREGAKRASALCDTQSEAKAAAQRMFPGVKPDIERVRRTNAGRPDRWRSGT